ncbi:hypothetical protein ACT7DP_15700 [Bacillus paranthracis]
MFYLFYLFIIFDSCIPYIFTASDGINQLLNKKGVPYLFGFYYSGVLLSYSFISLPLTK